MRHKRPHNGELGRPGNFVQWSRSRVDSKRQLHRARHDYSKHLRCHDRVHVDHFARSDKSLEHADRHLVHFAAIGIPGGMIAGGYLLEEFNRNTDPQKNSSSR